MIARSAIALFLALPLLGIAAPVAKAPDVVFNLDNVPLLTLVNIVYGDILQTNFAVHPDLSKMDKTVTVHFQSDMDKKKLSAFVVDLLAGVGVSVEAKPGYVYLSPAAKVEPVEPDFETLVYTPLYRPVAYIVDLTSSLFKSGRFTSQRSLRDANPVSLLPPASGFSVAQDRAGMSKPPQKQLPESGNSAAAQIDRNEVDSFIFHGPAADVAKLRQLLPQLDTPTAEVVVKGALYEVTTDKKEANAFNLVLGLAGRGVGVTIGQSPQSNSITFKSPAVDLMFSAIASDNRFKSLASPYLRVKSGASARVSVGSDVPVLGNVQTDKNGNPIQSINYRPSGVIFDLQPTIRGQVIDLQISQQLSSFVATSNGVNNSPTLIKREITTSIGVDDGDVIVLGGLDENKTTDDHSGFSFLPAWTHTTGQSGQQTQIVLILHVQKHLAKSI